MKKSFKKLENTIINCKKCPRLVNFRTQVAKDKRKQYINEKYWGKPITGFGDQKARILLVGLAPAAHSGNRTGRVFTGDRSSEFLYKCLHKAKLSNKSNSVHRNDGLILNDSFITTALKCVPPGDKPTKNELNNCFKYFKNEIENLVNTFESGSIAMVKSGKNNSSSTEFFFVTNKIQELDGRYSIFGKIIKGLDVLEKIKKEDYIKEVEISN